MFFKIRGTTVRYMDQGKVKTVSRYDLPPGNPYRLERRPRRLQQVFPREDRAEEEIRRIMEQQE